MIEVAVRSPTFHVQLVTRDELMKELSTKIADITFEKVDGTMRTLKATLIPRYLPPIVEEDDKKVRAINQDIVTVWDIEKNDWRSMRAKSIKSILYYAD